MSLLVSIPRNRFAPLRWSAEIVCRDMLGIDMQVVEGVGTDLVISAEGRLLILHSVFPDLSVDRQSWVVQLPKLPLAQWDVAGQLELDLDALLPVLFGEACITLSETEIACSIDIFGTIFFMLSRFEEIVLPDRDNHDRFPATASLAWKAGFLYRPIVDEYVELLWAMITRLWPGLVRKRRQGSIRVSCDVDRPFDPIGHNPISLLRALRRQLLVEWRPDMAAKRALNFAASPFGVYVFDPYHTFDAYMDICERHGRRATFYFIADRTAGALDGNYDIDESRIAGLMRKIAARGHEIGLHTSYNTYRDGNQIGKERDRLAAALRRAGLAVDVKGSRQHYLRWDAAETPDHLEEAGLDYDTTGSYADRPGFRYGTSHPFEMWSWRKLAPLGLRQYPLVLMECSVISANYLGLGHSAEAFDLMQTLGRRALRYGGDFNLLWHNSELMTADDRHFFETLVKGKL